jgi:hypothetical protein
VDPRIAIGIVASALLSACHSCSSPKSATGEEKQAATQLAGAFGKGTQIVGSLSYGRTSDAIAYSDPPRYRGLITFAGAAGDAVDIWVRSGNGDAIAWLADGSSNVIAKNDDAADDTPIS